MGNWHSILVVHYEPTDSILIKRLLREGGLTGGFIRPFSSLVFLATLLVFKGQFDFFEVLYNVGDTSCSRS